MVNRSFLLTQRPFIMSLNFPYALKILLFPIYHFLSSAPQNGWPINSVLVVSYVSGLYGTLVGNLQTEYSNVKEMYTQHLHSVE